MRRNCGASQRLALACIIIIISMVPLLGANQSAGTAPALARQLAAPATRSRTIETMKSQPRKFAPMLLQWSKRPPSGIERAALTEGLIEAFGELRVPDAVPFLVEHISDYTVVCCTWTKTSESILAKNPALRSLVEIGPQALPLLEREYRRPLDLDARVGVVFVIAQMKDPAAANFLREAWGAGMEQAHQAEEGLRLLGQTAPPK